MKSSDYWELFMQTGAPAYYLSYQALRRREDTDVSQNTWSGPAPDGIQ